MKSMKKENNTIQFAWQFDATHLGSIPTLFGSVVGVWGFTLVFL